MQPLDSLLEFHIDSRWWNSVAVVSGMLPRYPGVASHLQFVAANTGTSQVECRAIHIDKDSLVSLLNQAGSAFWLTRARSKEDRRRHERELTD